METDDSLLTTSCRSPKIRSSESSSIGFPPGGSIICIFKKRNGSFFKSSATSKVCISSETVVVSGVNRVQFSLSFEPKTATPPIRSGKRSEERRVGKERRKRSTRGEQNNRRVRR